jgi:hypothetical protein
MDNITSHDDDDDYDEFDDEEKEHDQEIEEAHAELMEAFETFDHLLKSYDIHTWEKWKAGGKLVSAQFHSSYPSAEELF